MSAGHKRQPEAASRVGGPKRVGDRPAGPAGTGGSALRSTTLPSLGDYPKIKDVVYQELRERIVFGGIAPGDRLVEAELAAQFGVSKTPVREALLTLEAEGLVIVRPHRGAEVSRLSVEEWSDLIFLRDALEVGALDAIMTAMTQAHFKEAEACIAEMAAAYEAQDYRAYRRAQRRLHATILGAPGYPSLPEAAVQLNDRLDRYARLLVSRDPSRWARDLDLNRRRLKLIRRRDAATYATLIRGRHTESSAIVAELAAATAQRGER